MATYQKKYWFQFVSLDGKTNKVELWQYTAATLTAAEVKAMNIPFSIELPEIDNIFQVVRGTGCEINLLSESDMQFFTGLYHVDKKEYIVKHYINDVINWLGYLNSELMRESYSFANNYPVQITGNDGFALMDRYQFLTDTGAWYVGLKSEYELLTIILDRIGLPFAEILIGLATTFTGYSSDADSTILHETYVDCANFYNEDGVSETMRKVLESILAPYGAIIAQLNGNVYITDIHTLAGGGNVTYKRFSITPNPGNLSGTIVSVTGGVEDNVARVDKVTFNASFSTIDITCNGYTKTISWVTSIAASIDAFIVTNANQFGQVYLTRISATELTFTAVWAGTNFSGATSATGDTTITTTTANVTGGLQVDTVTLTGTSGAAEITCNGFTERVVWSINLNTTASAFVSAHSALFGTAVVTGGTGTIIFTSFAPWSPLIGTTVITNVSTGATGYVEDLVVDNDKTISSIGYMGTDTEVEISGGKNKQVVTYSPYPIKEWLNNSLTNLEEFEIVGLYWVSRYKLNSRYLEMNQYWNAVKMELVRYYFDAIESYANVAAFPNPGETNITYIATDTGYHYRYNGIIYLKVDATLQYGSEQDIHIILTPNINNLKLASYKNTTQFLTLPKSDYTGTGTLAEKRITNGALIVIRGKIAAVRFVDETPTVPLSKENLFSHVFLTMKVKIGNYYYDGQKWTLVDSFFYPRISKKDDELMGLRWQIGAYTNYIVPQRNNLGNDGLDGIFIEIDRDLSGILEVEFWSDLHQDGGVDYASMVGQPHEVWLSDLSIAIAQADGTVIPDKDIEYIGYLDARYKDEAEKVTLLCGTESSIADRGKLLFLDTDGIYKRIPTWTRASQTFKIEELLLNSLCSNFRAGYYTLSNMKLENDFNQLNVLTDSYTGSRVFMVNSAKIIFGDNKIECNLVEISPDELTIVL